MNRISILVLGAVLAVSLCYGQDSTSAAATSAVGHGAFPVKVTKTLDSSKLKEGDAVEVETTGSFKLPDGTLVPKGSKLAGHVVTAKARSKGDTQSRLTLAFDKLSLANGKQLAIKGAVQAVFPPADEPDPGVPGASTNSHAGLAAGMPTPDYKPMNEVKNGSDAPNAHVEPAMDPKSVGVQGIGGLSLEDGILISKGKNVKLNGGNRMIVRADIF